MRIYISGPMRGIEEYNFPAFEDVYWRLKTLDHQVHNPADNDIWDEVNPIAAMNFDLSLVLNWAEAVYVLPGWEESNGARAEVFTALWRGIPIYEDVNKAGDFIRLATEQIWVKL